MKFPTINYLTVFNEVGQQLDPLITLAQMSSQKAFKHYHGAVAFND